MTTYIEREMFTLTKSCNLYISLLILKLEMTISVVYSCWWEDSRSNPIQQPQCPTNPCWLQLLGLGGSCSMNYCEVGKLICNVHLWNDVKASTWTSIKEAVVGVTCWELKFHLFKALVLSTFVYGAEMLGGDLKSSHWKVFEKGMNLHMMSHIKVCSSTTHYILLH